MKGENRRSEIKQVHGRNMGSSRTNHAANFKQSAPSHMLLRSKNTSNNLANFAQRKAVFQGNNIKALLK